MGILRVSKFPYKMGGRDYYIMRLLKPYSFSDEVLGVVDSMGHRSLDTLFSDEDYNIYTDEDVIVEFERLKELSEKFPDLSFLVILSQWCDNDDRRKDLWEAKVKGGKLKRKAVSYPKWDEIKPEKLDGSGDVVE
jgi:hypothetical protein